MRECLRVLGTEISHGETLKSGAGSPPETGAIRGSPPTAPASHLLVALLPRPLLFGPFQLLQQGRKVGR
jgi:hypothetical protein